LVSFAGLAASAGQDGVDEPADGEFVVVVEPGVLEHGADALDRRGLAERSHVVLDDLVVREVFEQRRL
jgi:hypothetical protein